MIFPPITRFNITADARAFAMNGGEKETIDMFLKRANKHLDLPKRSTIYKDVYDMCKQIETLGLIVEISSLNATTTNNQFLVIAGYRNVYDLNAYVAIPESKLNPIAGIVNPPVVSSTTAAVSSKIVLPRLSNATAYSGLLTKSERDQLVVHKFTKLFESAKKRNKVFELTVSDIRRLLKRKYCHYTGVAMTETNGDKFERTIDRIDPRLGYVPGNVVACTSFSNQLKNTLFENASLPNFIDFKSMIKMVDTLHELGFDNAYLSEQPDAEKT